MLEAMFDRKGPILFLSDAHFGAPSGAPERVDWFVDLLRASRGKIDGLMIVGDLFDFWFEYRHVIPKGHFKALRALAEIRESGVPVLYFGGNHDFWVGPYLKNEIGIEVVDAPCTFEIQGRRLFVAHGDGLGEGDRGYKFLKRVLRNPVCIGLYRALHPDLGIPLAYMVSATSRRHTEPREILLPKIVRGIVRPQFARGHDAVIIGHIHEPAHLRMAGADFIILGDWIDNCTYAVLEEGYFRLERYRTGAAPEKIPAADYLR